MKKFIRYSKQLSEVSAKGLETNCTKAVHFCYYFHQEMRLTRELQKNPKLTVKLERARKQARDLPDALLYGSFGS
ncbi:MAG: hypothetical protein K0R19_182 [Bacillota bacterium]|jgi:hypothetical protein|nr:hypothetical protein [Bacillota bacterium]